MTLRKHAADMRQLFRSLDEAAPAFRSSRAEVERLIGAMLDGAKVKPRAQAILVSHGATSIATEQVDVDRFLSELRQALYPVLVSCVQRMGGKVSGASASTVKSALRGMAQGEEAPPPDSDPAE